MATENTEVEDLLETLDTHRSLLRQTVSGVSDEQARERTTVSELCLAGIIKHVAEVEARWAQFLTEGPAAIGSFDPATIEAHMDSFRLLDGETLEGVLTGYDVVAKRTEETVRSLATLDEDHPLPTAPWFEPGARWSNRRVLVHIVAETAQHAGHADIIREALDGAKTMG
jgi:uncharacterized damage-inducible protein DinB